MTNKPMEESGICDGFGFMPRGCPPSSGQGPRGLENSILENEFWTAWSEHLGGPGSMLNTEDTVRRRLSPAQKELRDHSRNKKKDFSTNSGKEGGITMLRKKEMYLKSN